MKSNKTMGTGFTLIELMIVVAIIGILAAIAIPNFLKFQARSKSGEAKANLKAIFNCEQSYYQARDHYEASFSEVGFSAERGNRYAYTLLVAPTSWQDRSTSSLKTATSAAPYDGLEADSFKYPDLLSANGNVMAHGQQVGAADNLVTFGANTNQALLAPGTVNGVGQVIAGSAGAFAASAHGNIDNEVTGIDGWFVATEGALVAPGHCVTDSVDLQVSSGVPGHMYDDVACDN